ncbi:MAG: phosphocarrier protein HPr [Candidatus Fischerbacteria bacterium RBG_13_37_8]|uniref:Phosphocarrier protein HPr n=1 Tax=Candidatus Fischerbacteria bacterium RBG_13_37_8 TaxID=1817863 RepID=A0A1F5VGH3_9BACT|nr:MAG: phosphocarrier protein HPr [Candidatus Fischerbacteria bacterium RBG_13_37_8]
MIVKEIEVTNEKGLHARAAAKLVNIANKFKSRIDLKKNSQVSNAKSILGILILAACKGEKIELIISGTDEEKACEAIVNLFNNRFQEEQ